MEGGQPPFEECHLPCFFFASFLPSARPYPIKGSRWISLGKEEYASRYSHWIVLALSLYSSLRLSPALSGSGSLQLSPELFGSRRQRLSPRLPAHCTVDCRLLPPALRSRWFYGSLQRRLFSALGCSSRPRLSVGDTHCPCGSQARSQSLSIDSLCPKISCRQRPPLPGAGCGTWTHRGPIRQLPASLGRGALLPDNQVLLRAATIAL